ncbi:MAG: DUF2029 domain-containing protein [Phycisphaerae bacterium]|nr:DUF2029 domain-containing protein [Phycisphaerae bacterium]
MAGVVYLVGSWLSLNRRLSRRQVLLLIVVAVGMRVAAVPMPLARGDDFERYLWDGAVTAAGINPYLYSPKAVAEGGVADPTLRSLAARSQGVLRNVNHAELRAIYPPVAQGLFAVAHLLTPFDTTGWRIVLALVDLLTVLLLVLLLRSAGLALGNLAIYLWNPLLVFETYARLHLDLAVVPFLLVAAWGLVRRRPLIAGAFLATAAGVKLWPAVLAPFLVGAFRDARRRLLAASTAFAGICLLMAIPFSSAFGGENSGVVVYGATWETPTGAFRLAQALGWLLVRQLDLSMQAGLIARTVAMGLLLVAAVWIGTRRADRSTEICTRMEIVVLLMLLLSPTVWPWYYVPAIPLAVIAPRASALIWTAILPLIYLANVMPPPHVLGALIHLPVWVLLGLEWARYRTAPAGPEGEPYA